MRDSRRGKQREHRCLSEGSVVRDRELQEHPTSYHSLGAYRHRRLTVRHALRHPEREASSPVRAPPGFLGAARWFLATVEVPVGRGFARIKQRDAYRCTNPECGRRSLRTEAHHLHPRSLGGSDDAWNGVAVCRMCHVRGIHAGRVSARRVVVEGHDAVLWAWPDGRGIPGCSGAS